MPVVTIITWQDWPLVITMMRSAILKRLTVFSTLSLICALPSSTRKRSLTMENTRNIAPESNSTITIQPHPVTCFRSRLRPSIVPTDCGIVLNAILLREEGVFERRLFLATTYRTATGDSARSRWRHGQCQILVHANNGASQFLTLFDVALTANRIISKCFPGVSDPIGGTSLIGDLSKGFFVNVEGYPESASVFANTTSGDFQPATDFFSNHATT